MIRSVVGRITAIVVVVMIGVVMRIHRRSAVKITRRIATRRRRQNRIVAVIVEAVRRRAIVVTRTRSHTIDHPRLVVRSVPAKTYWFKVFESSEAVKLVVQFVVGHHRVNPRRIRAIGRDRDGNSSDAPRAHSHVLIGIAVTIVRIKVDVEIATIGVVSNILYIIVNGDRIGVVGQHGL